MPPQRLINKGALGTMIIFIIVTIVLVISLSMPWYNIHGDVEGEMRGSSYGTPISIDVEMEFDLDMYLQEQEMKSDTEASSLGETYSESDSDTDDYDDEDVESVMNTIFYLTIISIILIIIAIITAGLAAFGVISTRIGFVMVVIAMIFVLITLVYFPIGVPSALKESYDESESKEELTEMGLNYDGNFIGSSSAEMDMKDSLSDSEGLEEAPMEAKWTWGPSDGWYLIIISFVLALIGIIVFSVSGKTKQTGSNTDTIQNQPMQPYPTPSQPPLSPPQRYPPPPPQQYPTPPSQYYPPPQYPPR
jgi:hypothetical protein